MRKRRVHTIGMSMAVNALAVSAVKQFRITITLILNLQKQLSLTKHNSKILWRELGTMQVSFPSSFLEKAFLKAFSIFLVSVFYDDKEFHFAIGKVIFIINFE
jgi:hypothetical protein